MNKKRDNKIDKDNNSTALNLSAAAKQEEKLKQKSVLELKKFFMQKYLGLARNITSIPDLPHREFAFFLWDKNYMIRHKGYPNINIFRNELKTLNPRHVYVSAAVYQYPSVKKMDDKKWLGCDLVFDIDADHMDLPCIHEHDYHFCTKCNYYNKGPAPKECPQCGNRKFKKQPWLCDKCLDASKRELKKLIDMLINDFGFEPEDLHINFSGHRGYHLHVSNEKIRKLNSDHRRQISDYLTLTGFKPNKELIYSTTNNVFIGTRKNDPGLKGRIASEFERILRMDNYEDFEYIFWKELSPNAIKHLWDNRKYLLNNIINSNISWKIQNLGKTSWEKIFNVLKREVGCEIDVPVTIDIHRLIRLEGSIHGKTGFLVKKLTIDKLDDFDPFSDALIFSTSDDDKIPIQITSEICPPIRIGDNVYGPFNKNEKLKVNKALAVFLASKNVAYLL
ncbi:MAG: DNA primase small subunit domain-containing protein [Promethearchaeota archaeon]